MTSQFDSDSEFRSAVAQEPVVLRNWSAQDFSDLYIRYYPLVLRHARKYLTNFSQAEEVTQEAFLYLMTSLPEVDSEIGVLKILKWKTRLLALNVIEASQGNLTVPLAPNHESLTESDELSLQLERADDAAVVALALAKIEPRQREALVASLYEEKTRAQVAAQLGISENATTQLIYRAKASFRRALVGEAEIKGLSVSQILSVAARKAASQSHKYLAATSAAVLIVFLALGQPPTNRSQLVVDDARYFALAEVVESTPKPLGVVTPEKGSSNLSAIEAGNSEGSTAESEELPAQAVSGSNGKNLIQEDQREQMTAPVETASFASMADSEDTLKTQEAFFYLNSRPKIFEPFNGNSVELFSGQGFSVFLDYRSDQLRIANLAIMYREGSDLVYAFPSRIDTSNNYDGINYLIEFNSTGFGAFTADDDLSSVGTFKNTVVSGVISISPAGEVVSATLSVEE